MSMNHEFVIVDENLCKENYDNFTSDFFSDKSKFRYVSIHDSFVRYFSDYTRFIECYNPCCDEKVYGLCLLGITKIPFEKLESVIEILNCIHRIFSFSQENIKLKGEYVFENTDKDGDYERIEIKKEKFLHKLEKLIDLFKLAKREEKCIMHCGL